VRATLTTLLEVAGLAAIAAGCWAIAPALGLIAAGSAAVLVGWRLA
jgi:hypothetical protein